MRSKRGVAMAWAILFLFVISSITAMLTTTMFSSYSAIKNAKKSIQVEADINQIGEYYLRCIGSSGDFPNGNETNYNDFDWMDENAISFFKSCRDKYGYTFISESETDESKWYEGYTANGYIRRLTVRDDSGNDVLIVAVKEDIAYDESKGLFLVRRGNPESTFTVIEWTVNDKVGTLYEDSPGLFKRLWQGVTKLISNIVIRPTTYSVKFNTNGGSYLPGEQKIERGQSMTLPSNVTKKGAKFGGWDDGYSTYAAGATYKPTRNVTFTAKWTNYTVKFDANGGSGYSGGMKDGNVYTALPTAAKSGFKFVGWTTVANDANTLVSVPYAPNDDVTLYALYSELPVYLITYYDDDGTPLGTGSKIHGESYTISKGYNPVKPVDSKDGASYTVSFDYGSDGIGSVTSKDVKSSIVTAYTLSGWSDTKGSSTVKYKGGDTYNNNVALSLYPVYTLTTSTKYGDVTMPTVSVSGDSSKQFLGWSAAGDSRLYGENETYIGVDKNMTFTANYGVKTYTVTVNAVNGTVDTSTVANVPYGTKITVNKQKITVNGTTISATANKDTSDDDYNYTYSFDKWSVNNGYTVTGDVTITANFTETKTKKSCVTEDTLVLLADGTVKQIKDVESGEMLLAWDFEKGELTASPVVFNKGEENKEYEVIRAIFSDGTEVDVIGEHGFFDMDLGKYVYFDSTAAKYIGHSFAKLCGTENTSVTLTDVIIETRLTVPYDTNTYGTLCFYTNDMLSIAGGIEGIFNIFEVDTDTMTYDEEAMQADIAKFGLLDYESFPIELPEVMFDAFCGKYLAVSVGKGITTWENIAALAEYYLPYC